MLISNNPKGFLSNRFEADVPPPAFTLLSRARTFCSAFHLRLRRSAVDIDPNALRKCGVENTHV